MGLRKCDFPIPHSPFPHSAIPAFPIPDSPLPEASQFGKLHFYIFNGTFFWGR